VVKGPYPMTTFYFLSFHVAQVNQHHQTATQKVVLEYQLV
jgi:hypothetical protein